MIRVSLLCVCLILLHPGGIAAQDSENAVPISALAQGGRGAPELKLLLSDDFANDTLGDYSVSGDVRWDSGGLILDGKCSIERTIQGGQWTRFTIALDKLPVAASDSFMELQLSCPAPANSPYRVRVQQHAGESDSRTTISILNTIRQDGQPASAVIREQSVATTDLSQLLVDFRYGMITVSLNDSQVLAASVDEEWESVTGFSLQTESTTLRLGSLSVSGTAPPPPLTPEHAAQLAEADRLLDEAIAMEQKGDLKGAITHLERVADIHKTVLGTQHPAYATSLNNLGEFVRSNDQNERAELLQQEALAIRRATLGDQHPLTAQALNNIGASYYQAARYKEAREKFEQVRDVKKFVLGEKNSAYATSLNNLALTCESLGDYSTAESLYVEVLQIREEVEKSESPEYAYALVNLSVLLQQTGQFGKAEKVFRQAIDVLDRTRSKEHPDYAVALNNLAVLYSDIGEYARCEQLLKQALEIQKRTRGEQHSSYGRCLSNLARHYQDVADFPQAEQYAQQASLVLRSTLGEQHSDYGICLNNLATLYNRMGDHTKADQLCRQVLEIQRSTTGSQHLSYATTLNNLACIARDRGELTTSLDLLQQASDLTKNALGEQHASYAQSLRNLGTIQQLTGADQQAEPLFRRSTEILKATVGSEHPDYAMSLDYLGMLYLATGRYAEAEQKFSEAHAIHCLVAARLVPTLAEAQARSWVQQNRPRTDLLLTAIKRQQKQNAPQAYESVWGSKLLGSRLRTGLGVSSNTSTETKQALSRLRDARLGLARLVSATPTPEQAQRYLQALTLASQKKENLERELAALSPVSQRELAVRDATVDSLLRILPPGVAVIDFVQLDEWDPTDVEVALTHQDGQAESRTSRQLNATPCYEAFVLRSDRIGEEHTIRWISLGPTEPIDQAIEMWRELLTGNAAGRSLGTSSRAVNPSGKPSEDPAQLLRSLLWDKLEPEVKDCHTIIVLPDAALHRLPWAALPGRKPGNFLIHDYRLSTAASGHQLFGVLTAPPIESAQSFLAVGGIQYDERPTPTASPETQLLASRGFTVDVTAEERRWAFLEGAAAELTGVSEIWGDRGVVHQLDGLSADEQTVMQSLPESRFVHLATHGFFDTQGEIYRVNLRDQKLFHPEMSGASINVSLASRNPLLMTGLVMAGANVPPEKDALGLPVGADGILTAEEILGLDLQNTELVTMSACETGLGDVAVGEGVMGLTRVLHQAGVHTVLSSLWKVDDAATQLLMTEFYRNLWERKLNKLDALREAQLTMLNNYDPVNRRLNRGLGTQSQKAASETRPDPISSDSNAPALDPAFWAAFQLSGDWR